MRKILVLSLLFAMFVVPTSAQETRLEEATALEKFYVFAIQSFGWKCSRMESYKIGNTSLKILPVLRAERIICEDNLTYYVRSISKGSSGEQMTFCHKGTCKRFE